MNKESASQGNETREPQQPAHTAAAAARRVADKMKAEEERAEVALERLKEVGKNLGDQIEDQLRERPYVVLGVATGIGFIAGSVMGSRLGQMAVALAGGYLARNLLANAGYLGKEGETRTRVRSTDDARYCLTNLSVIRSLSPMATKRGRSASV